MRLSMRSAVFRRPYSNSVAEKLKQRIREFDDPQRRFDYDYQRKIGLTSVPKYAPKSAKVIAEATPWTGEEHPFDTSNRMLNDAIKPMKVSRQKRLSDARENVLDYQLNAVEGPTHKERLTKYQPRQSRATSGLSSGGWIESVAHNEIENAIKRGQFKDIKRGENALDSKHDLVASSKNPQLDFTEYLMNNIIKKQGGAPPWIMKQIAMRESIEKFRTDIRRSLQERLVHKVVTESKSNGQRAIELARTLAVRNPEWEEQYAAYHTEMVELLNRTIRSYNLQAPTSARKGYLNLSEELEKCYAQALDGIEERILRFVGEAVVHKASRSGLHSSIPPVESSDKHYGLKHLIRDLFLRRSPRT